MTQPPGPDTPGSSPNPGDAPDPSSGAYPPPVSPYPPPPPGYGPGYPPPPPPPYSGYAAVPAVMKNGVGIAALVVALISLPAALTIVGGIVLGVAAIILGFVGRNRVRNGEANNGGVAMAGIVLGALGVLFSIVMIVIAVVAGRWFMDIGGRDFVDCMREAGDDQAAQQQCEDQFRGSLEENLSVTLTPTP
jgi:Domain of unknown function (DUF4190)